MKLRVSKEYTIQFDTEELEELREPLLYQVVMHNDDFTPMEFVVSLLERFFNMDRRQAADVMMDAHINGKAACGAFVRDVAETKVAQVVEYAQLHEHPLICSMEAV